MKELFWSKEEISSFCLELSLLLKAGLPAEICFSILAEEEKDNRKKEILNGLYEKSGYGDSVYEAMAEAGVFPDYMLKMVKMGEETGYLESVFRALSVYYEERRRTEQALKETVVFPVVLLVMMLVVVVLLMTEVLPVFQDVFKQLGGTLSPAAMFFLNIGTGLRKAKVFFMMIGILLLIGFLVVCFHEGAKEKWSQFWEKRFSATKTGKLFETAHFVSALHMGVSGGLDTDKALELAEAFCEKSMQEKISACRESALMGMPLSEAVEEHKLMKPMYCRMLSVGVKTGALDSTLEEISRRSQEEASAAQHKAASRVEPAVVIILCVIVGVLLLSVMFPLVGIMNSL
ncbi:MAG: type II secretion system F family protein [Anaerotignum sp.]|nr:type II secretion system F family protein [Anaerotignum sp.]